MCKPPPSPKHIAQKPNLTLAHIPKTTDAFPMLFENWRCFFQFLRTHTQKKKAFFFFACPNSESTRKARVTHSRFEKKNYSHKYSHLLNITRIYSHSLENTQHYSKSNPHHHLSSFFKFSTITRYIRKKYENIRKNSNTHNRDAYHPANNAELGKIWFSAFFNSSARNPKLTKNTTHTHVDGCSPWWRKTDGFKDFLTRFFWFLRMHTRHFSKKKHA